MMAKYIRKKSQLSIFIIIFLFLAFMAGLYFYSSNKPNLNKIRESEDVNLKEIKPVKAYIEDVITRLVIDGFFLIGKQGGILYETTWPACKAENPNVDKFHRLCNQTGRYDYFSYPDYLKDTPYRHKRVNIGINDSRELGITRASVLPLSQPFSYPHINWELAKHYLYGMNQPLPEITSMVVDPKRSIEIQVSNFASIHLPAMLDFSEFEKRGYKISHQKEYPRVHVKVGEDDISVQVYYNFTIEKSGLTYKLDEFFVNIDYNFRRLYTFVQRLIQADMTTLNNILGYRMLDEKGNEIGQVYRLESATSPPNYEYDLIYVIDRSFDWSKWYNYEDTYNPEPQYYTFYFIRENRAPDASTVYNVPEKIEPGQTTTWFCPNFMTSGQWFDPDEDDMYTEEFPFKSPKWYIWKSRGDYLEYEKVEKNCDGYYDHPPKRIKIRLHTEKNHEEDDENNGISFLEDNNGLAACGNEVYKFKTKPARDDDVGDVVILKVGDQMDYASGESQGPLSYPEGPITEEGSGRLNDVISFQPVKCNPNNECCKDNVWNLDNPPRSEKKELICVQKCEDFCESHISCPKDCKVSSTGCCAKVKEFYYVCDHNGETVLSNKPASKEINVAESNCNCFCTPEKSDSSGTICPT